MHVISVGSDDRHHRHRQLLCCSPCHRDLMPHLCDTCLQATQMGAAKLSSQASPSVRANPISASRHFARRPRAPAVEPGVSTTALIETHLVKRKHCCSYRPQSDTAGSAYSTAGRVYRRRWWMTLPRAVGFLWLQTRPSRLSKRTGIGEEGRRSFDWPLTRRRWWEVAMYTPRAVTTFLALSFCPTTRQT
jgi:hypothetical protein